MRYTWYSRSARDKSTLCAAPVGSVTHLGATTDASSSPTADGRLFT